MIINLKKLLYLPIILFFFPAFAFYLPALGGVYNFFFLSLYLCIIIIFIKNPKYVVNKTIDVYNTTPFKYFIWFFFFVVLNSVILSIFGVTHIGYLIRGIIFKWILCIFSVFMYFIIIDKYIPFEKMIKTFMSIVWFNFVIGFIAYTGQVFNIELINNIFDFFANQRFLMLEVHSDGSMQAANYSAFGLKRLDNLCEEPSGYAQMIYLLLPWIYSFSKVKFKLVKNNLLNKIMNNTFIPFAWISIILTFSPIYLVLGIVITLIYYMRQLFTYLKKYFILILLIFLIIVVGINYINISETYLSRIINVIIKIRSFDDLVIIEPSLATRFGSYINCFCIFLQHPFSGVGVNNMINFMYNQYLHSPVTLTPEIIETSRSSILLNGNPFYNPNYVYTLLAENGIFVFSVLVYFVYRLFKNLNIIIQKRITNNLEYATGKALKYTLIALVIISFYNLHFVSYSTYFYISIMIMFIYKIKQKQQRRDIS